MPQNGHFEVKMIAEISHIGLLATHVMKEVLKRANN
jgi:hypothetical protein